MKKLLIIFASLSLVILASAMPAQAKSNDGLAFSWDGQNFVNKTFESFVGMPTIAPGSTKMRTLTVRNDGPSTGILKSKIFNITTLAPNDSDIHHNPNHVAPPGDYLGAGPQGDFYKDLKLAWSTNKNKSSSVSFADAAGTTIPMGSYKLKPGQAVTFTLGYDFPSEATSGNKANVNPRLASFDVNFTIMGDTDNSGDTPNTPNTPNTSNTPNTPNKDNSNKGRSGIPNTGGPALGLLILGVSLIGVGSLLAHRRKRTK